MPTGLDESSHVISALSGYNGSAARITDDLEYQDSLDEDLALTVTSPASPELNPGAPLNLLLDLAGQYRHHHTGEEISSDDMCVDRVGAASGTAARPAGRFIVPINNTPYELTLIYNTATGRYRIDAPILDADFVRTAGRAYPLTRALNETQAFTVIPENRDIIYVHGGASTRWASNSGQNDSTPTCSRLDTAFTLRPSSKTYTLRKLSKAATTTTTVPIPSSASSTAGKTASTPTCWA